MAHDSQQNGTLQAPMRRSGTPTLPIEVRDDDERIVSVGDILRIVWRRWYLITLVAAVFLGLAVGFALMQTPTYTASIIVMIGQDRAESAPTSLTGDIQGLEQLSETVATVIATHPIAQGVIEERNLSIDSETFLKKMDAQPIEDTLLVKVNYEDPDPRKAQRVANTIGAVFSKRIAEMDTGTSSVTVRVWEPAVLPTQPSDPEPVRDAVLALMLGLMTGVGLAILLEYLGRRSHPQEEKRLLADPSTRAAVPEHRSQEGHEEQG